MAMGPNIVSVRRLTHPVPMQVVGHNRHDRMPSLLEERDRRSLVGPLNDLIIKLIIIEYANLR